MTFSYGVSAATLKKCWLAAFPLMIFRGLGTRCPFQDLQPRLDDAAKGALISFPSCLLNLKGNETQRAVAFVQCLDCRK